jgi:hypothetical protein
VRFVFQISKSQKKKYSKKNYPELEYYVMCGNFKFQTQDSFWNILFWRFEEQITLSEKKHLLYKQSHEEGAKLDF